MKVGILSDAHGNMIGFKKCLDFLRPRVDHIYFLGDAVGYFPFPNEIIDVLRNDKSIISLLGNHDAMLLGLLDYDNDIEIVYRLKETNKVIKEENLHFLKGLLPFERLEADKTRILFIHGSPFKPLNGYIYPDSDLSDFQNIEYDTIFMGHTHRSFIKEINGKHIVNVGSCGLPRDIGNRLTVVIYDTVTGAVNIHELMLDIEEVFDKYGDYIHESVKEVLKRNNSKFDEK